MLKFPTVRGIMPETAYIEIFLGLLSCLGVLVTLLITALGWLYTALEQRNLLRMQIGFDRKKTIYEQGTPHLLSQINKFEEWIDKGFELYYEFITTADAWETYPAMREEPLKNWVEWDKKAPYYLVLTKIWDARFNGTAKDYFKGFYSTAIKVMALKAEEIIKQLDDDRRTGEIYVPSNFYFQLTEELDRYRTEAFRDVE